MLEYLVKDLTYDSLAMGVDMKHRSATERRNQISQLTSRKDQVAIQELQSMFQVSEVTLRRDLDFLESQGHIRRVRGGAVSNRASDLALKFQEKLEYKVAEKREIARIAASLVEPGQVVMLSGGTTTMFIARELCNKRDITIVTPAINIVAELAGYDSVTLVVIGGIVRKDSYVAAGHIADETLKGMTADIAFVGVDGVDISAGFTTPNLVESRTDRTMLQSANRGIIVADNSKLGKIFLSPVAQLEEPSMLVTDSEAPRDYVEQLREQGCRVLFGYET